jgi:hypothetical protein
LEGGAKLGPTFTETGDKFIEFLAGTQALADSSQEFANALQENE